jgi:hypothetical protein
MALCYSCRNIRLGKNGNGDTLQEGIDAVKKVANAGQYSIAYEMLQVIGNQAIDGGLCKSCLFNELQPIKSELERRL